MACRRIYLHASRGLAGDTQDRELKAGGFLTTICRGEHLALQAPVALARRQPSSSTSPRSRASELLLRRRGRLLQHRGERHAFRARRLEQQRLELAVLAEVVRLARIGLEVERRTTATRLRWHELVAQYFSPPRTMQSSRRPKAVVARVERACVTA
jgi:hypothetical protein